MASSAAERKLTTILAADVVGYSQLMATDEEATLTTFQAYSRVVEELVSNHHGRIFNTAGDAILAEFPSAVEGVRCAITIQEDLRIRNSQLAEDKQVWLRIGINIGDVMIDKQDLFGDGVNIAARLEGLAETGGICISGSVFDQVKNKLSFAFDDIGLQKVKNIPDPIPAYKVVPGQVAVEGDKKSTASQIWPEFSAGNLKLMVIAGATVLTVLVVGMFVFDLLPRGLTPKHQFDGYWKITVTSLSGCLDNAPAAYSISVANGRIDEPQHQFPKVGTITPDGKFIIKTTDRAGNAFNTQTGLIIGDAGKGRFQGSRPTCSGVVTLVRLN